MAITLGATGIVNDTPFYSSSNTITSNFTTTAGYNYMSVGPIYINTGALVTVTNGSAWSIV